jgi:hypothetical protein
MRLRTVAGESFLDTGKPANVESYRFEVIIGMAAKARSSPIIRSPCGPGLS